MRSARRRMLIVGIAIALCIASASAFVASSRPDGLERVAEDLGFIESARGARYELLPDYTVPGLGDGPLSRIAVGAIGVVLIAGITIGAGKMLSRSRDR